MLAAAGEQHTHAGNPAGQTVDGTSFSNSLCAERLSSSKPRVSCARCDSDHHGNKHQHGRVCADAQQLGHSKPSVLQRDALSVRPARLPVPGRVRDTSQGGLQPSNLTAAAQRSLRIVANVSQASDAVRAYRVLHSHSYCRVWLLFCSLSTSFTTTTSRVWLPWHPSIYRTRLASGCSLRFYRILTQ